MDFCNRISVCLLTFNSSRLLRDVLQPVAAFADEIIVVDSGSTDGTLAICDDFNIKPLYHPFETHGRQMNYAISRARHDWVCAWTALRSWMMKRSTRCGFSSAPQAPTKITPIAFVAIGLCWDRRSERFIPSRHRITPFAFFIARW